MLIDGWFRSIYQVYVEIQQARGPWREDNELSPSRSFPTAGRPKPTTCEVCSCCTEIRCRQSIHPLPSLIFLISLLHPSSLLCPAHPSVFPPHFLSDGSTIGSYPSPIHAVSCAGQRERSGASINHSVCERGGTLGFVFELDFPGQACG